MKTNRIHLLAIVGAVTMLFLGCESNDDNSSSSTTLAISPASIQFSAAQVTTVTFEVSGGTPAYSWSVNNTNLGWIVSSGDTAIYTSRTNAGQNFVVAQDANSNVISATVVQL